MNIEQIACVAHETNRAYCESMGDHSQKPWDESPEWQKDSARNGVRFHLKCHKAGAPPAASAAHDAWLADKVADGWKFGPVKDAEKKEHPCCVPYEQLPPEQQLKDHLFTSIVAAYVKHCGTELE